MKGDRLTGINALASRPIPTPSPHILSDLYEDSIFWQAFSAYRLWYLFIFHFAALNGIAKSWCKKTASICFSNNTTLYLIHRNTRYSHHKTQFKGNDDRPSSQQQNTNNISSNSSWCWMATIFNEYFAISKLFQVNKKRSQWALIKLKQYIPYMILAHWKQ